VRRTSVGQSGKVPPESLGYTLSLILFGAAKLGFANKEHCAIAKAPTPKHTCLKIWLKALTLKFFIIFSTMVTLQTIRRQKSLCSSLNPRGLGDQAPTFRTTGRGLGSKPSLYQFKKVLQYFLELKPSPARVLEAQNLWRTLRVHHKFWLWVLIMTSYLCNISQ
jgi:hypothetical protein